jgi:hypothetical protein
MRHGTISCYVNEACRCSPCCEAWAAYHRRWRSGRKERGVCRYCNRQRGAGLLCAEHKAKANAAARAYYENEERPLRRAQLMEQNERRYLAVGHFAVNLRRYRVGARFKQVELAQRAGAPFTQQYVSALERGLRPSDPAHVGVLASVLNVTEAMLLRPVRRKSAEVTVGNALLAAVTG